MSVILTMFGLSAAVILFALVLAARTRGGNPYPAKDSGAAAGADGSDAATMMLVMGSVMASSPADGGSCDVGDVGGVGGGDC